MEHHRPLMTLFSFELIPQLFPAVADFTPSVTVTTSGGEPVAGTSFVLTCTVAIFPGVTVVPDIEWSGHGIGMPWATTGRTISGDGVHTRQVTLRPLVLAHGGAYTCTARFSLNGVTSRDGVDQTQLSVLSECSIKQTKCE